MKEVIEEAVRQLQDQQPCVLATVVRTKGSTPQKAGSMLLVRRDGSGVGTLGGGCVEGDIWYAAREMLRNQSGPEFKDYFLNEDIAARDGLVCGGTMYFYLEPMYEPDSFLDIGQRLIDAYEGGDPVGLATAVNVPDGSPNLGAKLMLLLDGSVVGTLGNREVDERAMSACRQVADVGSTDSFTTDEGMEVFVEGFTTPPTLTVIGGGHVGKATADLANMLGYRVFIVDDRPEFSNPERFPYAEQTVVTQYDRWSEDLSVNVNTFVVVATPGPPLRRHGAGVGAEDQGPLHRSDGQPAQEPDDLPPPAGPGSVAGTAQGSPCAHWAGHWRTAAGRTGRKHHVRDNNGKAGRQGRPHADGRVVHRPGGGAVSTTPSKSDTNLISKKHERR